MNINPRSRELCLHELDKYVRFDRPRIFAIYGVYQEDHENLDIICGWGMEWEAEYGGALFYDPSSRATWHSDSADNLVQRYRRIADVRLVRFDTDTDTDTDAVP
ncbi:hypothetical protein CFN78_20300 [Amycolatopsis antarctica]|uniref:Uncharacterized protein n=1 Tax=Amycolatopsis antarctica TaxID=1854586 RepID=A0A263CZ84_9PSEU|nr:hypothetical protein [Amycolatopsis antarctica]OZM71484.1 hypothetical protein CFN78_20300 [Amycolatopsis antarctica]